MRKLDSPVFVSINNATTTREENPLSCSRGFTIYRTYQQSIESPTLSIHICEDKSDSFTIESGLVKQLTWIQRHMNWSLSVDDGDWKTKSRKTKTTRSGEWLCKYAVSIQKSIHDWTGHSCALQFHRQACRTVKAFSRDGNGTLSLFLFLFSFFFGSLNSSVFLVTSTFSPLYIIPTGKWISTTTTFFCSLHRRINLAVNWFLLCCRKLHRIESINFPKVFLNKTLRCELWGCARWEFAHRHPSELLCWLCGCYWR